MECCHTAGFRVPDVAWHSQSYVGQAEFRRPLARPKLCRAGRIPDAAQYAPSYVGQAGARTRRLALGARNWGSGFGVAVGLQAPEVHARVRLSPYLMPGTLISWLLIS
jgi:hypothetical protein